MVYFPVKHSCLYNNDYINNNEIPNFFTLIVFSVRKAKKNYTSSKNSERCFFMCKKNDTSNQKPQRSVSFAPKFLPFKGACSLQRPLQHRLADIQRDEFFSKSFSLGGGGGGFRLKGVAFSCFRYMKG